MTFDLSNISFDELNTKEFVDFVLRQDREKFYEFIFDMLSIYALSPEPIDLRVEKFLANRKFDIYRKIIYDFLSLDLDTPDGCFPSYRSLSNIYVPVAIGCIRSNLKRFPRDYELEELEELENRYYIKKQRKLKLKQLMEYENQTN